MIPKLTDEQINEIYISASKYEFKQKLDAAVHQQYKEWVKGQEPCGYRIKTFKSVHAFVVRGDVAEERASKLADIHGESNVTVDPVFTHTAPDDTELLKQALEALESLFNGQPDDGRAQRCSNAIAALRARLENKA